MTEFRAALDALDLAVALAGRALGEEAVAGAAAVARRARERRGFLGTALVLAIAGGTGSGKSSLLNALAGEEVASVGAIRPHTEEPLAWVPAPLDPGLEALLDRFAVSARVLQERFPDIALIDLPDMDSVAAGHRATVDRLLPEVDGVIWVMDPEKYRDPVLHREYLAPLADAAPRLLFVLNHADRLGARAPMVAADLAAALAADGIAGSPIFVTAAAPAGGREPSGVDELATHLAARLDAKHLALGRLAADLRAAAEEVARAAGAAAVPRLDFDARWAEVTAGAAATLAAGAAGAVDDAACVIEDFVAGLAVEAGPAFGRRVRMAALPEQVEAAVTAVGAEAAGKLAGPGVRGLFGVRRGVVAAIEREAAGDLDRRLGARLRAALWDRAHIVAALVGLEVELARSGL